MCEPAPSTHILLKQMKSTDHKLCDDAFKLLVYRFRGPFERYAKSKLGSDDACPATDDTFWKIYRRKDLYEEAKCTCRQACQCAERNAHKYLWTIHENTVKDWLRRTKQCSPLETLDETWPTPESSKTRPEAHMDAMEIQRIILRVWKGLSEDDQKLISIDKRPGRPNQRLRQAQREACERFRIALKAALEEGGYDE